MSGHLPQPWRGEPLARHTSLKVGGPADFFALAGTARELAALLGWARAEGLAVRAIGGGSNLLVADAGVDGLVVKVQVGGCRVEEGGGEPVLVVGAGVGLASVARRVSREGLRGLEWAANVPGTVGGAVANNAGAFGGDIATCLVAATVVDASGRCIRLEPAELRYAYRSSALKRRDLDAVAVVEAELRLQRGSAEESRALVAHHQAQRTRSQPRRLSAGSVFANPPGDYAGRLIEDAGLKGARAGGAEISRQHANFIVNLGGATAADVYALARLAQDAVYAHAAVWLLPEIELLGRWSGVELERLRAPVGGEVPPSSLGCEAARRGRSLGSPEG